MKSRLLVVVLSGLMLPLTGPGMAQQAERDNAATPGGDPEPAGTPENDPDLTPEREIIIGAGGVAGAYFPVAGAICRMVAARGAGLRCLVESNMDSSANLERLRDGRLDFAIVQSDWLMHAARGTNIFRPDGPDDTLRAVMALQAETLTLMARADRGIGSLSDLEGKTVNLGPLLTYPRILAGALLDAAGMDAGDLAGITELSMTEQIAALCLGEIDVAVAVIAHPSPALSTALARCDLRLVPVEGKAVAKLLKDRPEWASATIPGGIYVGIPDAVPSFGLRAVLATTSRAEDRVVDAVVRSIFLSLDDFRGQHPLLGTVTVSEMASAGIALPLHDGALARFSKDGAAAD